MAEWLTEGYAAGWMSTDGAFLIVPPPVSGDAVHKTREAVLTAAAPSHPDLAVHYVRREFHSAGSYYVEMFRIIAEPGHSR